jgi:hypothetical protein
VVDGTTRLLCAAAHRHDWFAEAVIREYLVEQVGTVPPSPGLDTAAVLGDAVAARTRYRARDAVLLVLMAVLTVVNPVAVVAWMVACWVWSKFAAQRDGLRDAGVFLAWVGSLALLGLVGLIKVGTGIGLPAGDRTWWPSVVITATALIVLMADTWLVRVYLRRRFKPKTFVGDVDRVGSRFERWLRGLGRRRYATQLDRFAEADEHSAGSAGVADVIVHRGETPFVGAGYVLPTQGVPIALRAAVGSAKPSGEVDLQQLYDRIARELVPVTGAGRSDGRIDAIVHRDQVLIPVVDLVHERGTTFGKQVLGDLDEPPVRHLPVEEVRRVAADRLEWAPYYSCFRRESWNRNLVTSCYVHLTMRRRTLQIEVTHCVLPPVRDWLNEADRVLRIGTGPFIAGSVELLRLPRTIRVRLRRCTRSLRPRRVRTRGIDSDRYGAGGSLREGVSPGTEDAHYFKRNDATRQITMVHNELFAVVIEYLEDRGYDVSELGRRAATMIENHTMNINNSSFVNTTITNGAVNPPAQPASTPAPTPTPA